MMHTGWALLLLSSLAIPAAAAPPLDGEGVPLESDLAEKLAGDWDLTGTVMGQPARQRMSARWTLAHQFLRLHVVEVDPKKPDASLYEAHVYLGFDHMSERWVAHWIDVFGGRFSETLGYGPRTAAEIELVFEYPDGPFRTTFALTKAGGWSLVMRQKDKSGRWSTFSEMHLTRRPAPARDSGPSPD